jgi:hypothetical protein
LLNTVIASGGDIVAIRQAVAIVAGALKRHFSRFPTARRRAVPASSSAMKARIPSASRDLDDGHATRLRC